MSDSVDVTSASGRGVVSEVDLCMQLPWRLERN